MYIYKNMDLNCIYTVLQYNYYYYLLSNIYKSIGSVPEQFMVHSVDIVEHLNLCRK